MKTKKQLLKSELKEHGTPKRFKQIKAAKTPEKLAEVIVRQHGTPTKPIKRCRKCGKVKRHCEC